MLKKVSVNPVVQDWYEHDMHVLAQRSTEFGLEETEVGEETREELRRRCLEEVLDPRPVKLEEILDLRRQYEK